MENLGELLNRFNVTYKVFFLDEYEAKHIKEWNRRIETIIMNYWLKLDIELEYQLDNQTAIKWTNGRAQHMKRIIEANIRKRLFK